MKHRSRGHRLLPMAGAALIDPWTSLQPPGLSPAAAGAHKTAGPAKPGQVLDAALLRSEPCCKIQKSSHSLPPNRLGYATLRRGRQQAHLANLRQPDREIVLSIRMFFRMGSFL